MKGFPNVRIASLCGLSAMWTWLRVHRYVPGSLGATGVKVKVPVLCATCFRKEGPLPKIEGTVKWFSPRKQYGFITANDGQDVFLHQRQILDDQMDDPQQGQKTRFHIRLSAKGPEAINVELG